MNLSKRIMIRKIWMAAFVCCAITGYAQDKTFTGIELQPTVAYVKNNGQDSRLVRLVFHGGSSYAAASVDLQFNGISKKFAVPESKEGLTTFDLPLPGGAIDKDQQLEVKVTAQGRYYNARCVVQPARKWTVYVLPHSHVDIGYTNVQEKVLKIHMDNIDEAIEIAKKTESYPEGARYKWNTEAMWVVDNYLSRSDAAKKRRFADAVKKGWINVDAAYGNINTSMTDARQLMQMFYAGVHLGKDLGVKMETMFQGDVPGSSWGLASQSHITGIRYFLSAPNAGDRIGNSPRWTDRPFYWTSPSGGQKMLFYQSQPYSIGYSLKGSKIPNFFTIEDPKPFYTNTPSENFLDPFIFKYLSDLEVKGSPYNITLVTWAMSDNAPIDPELPDAVKAWNEKFASPKLVITSTREFFHDFEAAYADKIPVVSGDYTEYWTDGVASAARETGFNRNASDRLQQADAIWALRNKAGYPAAQFNKIWTSLLLFNEHTWGAHNSVSNPEDPKAVSQWQYKQAFSLEAKKWSSDALQSAVAGDSIANAIDVYNTLGVTRTELVTVAAAKSQAGDLVLDAAGKKVPSQRLSSGDLAFLVQQVPPFSKKRFTISKGKAYTNTKATVTAAGLQNGIYNIALDPQTGNIIKLEKGGRNVADSAGLDQYSYLPGNNLKEIAHSGVGSITVKEKGPLVVSLLVQSPAPGATLLSREIKLVAGVDRVEVINTIDKQAVSAKEGVHFAFPFKVPGAQVRYSIPWGSVMAEADQLQYANRNWYTLQRWADVSNNNLGVTWSSPDAPLFEIGNYTTAGLLGGLYNSPLWIKYTEQSPVIHSWVMNNLWHTNFRRDQEGETVFRYFLNVHGAFDNYEASVQGLINHHPLTAAAASGNAKEELFFDLTANGVYIEALKPAADGQGVILELVNATGAASKVNLAPKDKNAVLRINTSNLLEGNTGTLNNNFEIPAKGVMMVRVAIQ